jgi:hypothetical protein
MQRHLAVAVLAVLGVLFWASAVPAANVLTLCITPGGAVKAAATCKTGETQFKVVSEADFSALQSQVEALQTQVDALEDQQAAIDALQTSVDGFTALLAGASRPDADTLLLSGMNLQVVNGSGATDGSANSLGNIIIGYNANFGDTQTGSHNLVIGDRHTYTSTSGVVAGLDNAMTGTRSFVAGGAGNTASGFSSFVGGGIFNTASGDVSFVAGGAGNTASGLESFVGGGNSNTASGDFSFVGGGGGNTAGPGTCGVVISAVFGTC